MTTRKKRVFRVTKRQFILPTSKQEVTAMSNTDKCRYLSDYDAEIKRLHAIIENAKKALSEK